MFYKFLILICIFLYILFYKFSLKKGYDISIISVWFFICIVIIWSLKLYILSPIILISCFLFKNLYTPIFFTINNLQTVLGVSNRFREISRKLFIDNAIFRENFRDIPNEPTIWLLNYPCKNIIEYYTLGLLPNCGWNIIINKKFKGIMSKAINKDKIICIDFSKKENYEEIKNKIKYIIKVKKENIVVYFDTKVDYKGFKNRLYTLQTPRTGILRIARDLGIRITPIIIDHLYISNGLIPHQNFEIYVDKPIFIKNIEKDLYFLIKKYNKTLSKFLINKFRKL